MAAGFFLDALILPTCEGDPIIYRKAPVLVHDFTVEISTGSDGEEAGERQNR
jgi:hypothetical protein